MDIMTAEQRHRVMSHIKCRNTSIEISLRKSLWHRGIHYKKNYAKLPGSPDIAITKYRIAIFCDSEFFHGFDWEKKQHRIGNNREYWIKKISHNIDRDIEVNHMLSSQGWTVIRFWGHDIRTNVDACVDTIQDAIFNVSLNSCVEDSGDIFNNIDN